MRVLLVTPPFLQINSPYPAAANLVGYLNSLGHEAHQADLSLGVSLRLLSAAGIAEIAAIAESRFPELDEAGQEVAAFFIESRNEYVATIGPVMRFLQGEDDSLALRIVARKWLPEGPRFLPLQEHSELLESFGTLGVRDQAKYLASLYVDDVADVVRLVVDGDFGLAKYGEALASSQSSFTPLHQRLHTKSPTLIDRLIDEETEKLMKKYSPRVVGFTCPFPGNVYGALRAAKTIKAKWPEIITVMGGGFVNTELREIDDPRFFADIDFLSFDDGERPLELLLDHVAGPRSRGDLLRTKWVEDGRVVGSAASTGPAKDVAFKDLPTPDFSDLELTKYVSMMEMPNAMHRLWSDFRWNKLTLAHGCYWRRCTFCDVNLDYIQRYEPDRVDHLVEKMKSIAQQTGSNGFHFVDEAAPPALLKTLSLKLREEQLPFTWWGNLRFDKQFTPELAELMSEAGCVAVTGGLEVASPRILELIDKGVSIEQAARVTKAFSEAGIFVHAYLMYGFPTQTEQETIDSLEVVRQLFASGCLHSAHWHRFVATHHSPVGRDPAKYGIVLKDDAKPKEGWFARNAIAFADATGCDHDRLGEGLRRAVYNYMHGVGLDKPVTTWFKGRVPAPTLKKNYVDLAL